MGKIYLAALVLFCMIFILGCGKQNREMALQEDDGSFVPDMVYAALSPKGELYFSDRSDLRYITKNGAKNLCNCQELNYPLSELRGMSVLEDDSMLLSVEMTEKQEIVLAAAGRDSMPTNALRCFNKQNNKYYDEAMNVEGAQKTVSWWILSI